MGKKLKGEIQCLRLFETLSTFLDSTSRFFILLFSIFFYSDAVKKKHKKNKHKKHHVLEDGDVNSSRSDGFVKEDVSSIHRPIKLKIKLGDELISSSNATM